MDPERSNGIHHVTLITRDVQANVDFYVGFLGLHLVKRTGGYEDGQQLHLFYGDDQGAPGSLVTFLVWQDGAPGRAGLGQVSEIAFAVPATSIGGWLVRALDQGVPVQGPLREFGEPVLRLKDPDGFIVKLVGLAEGATGSENAVGRLRAVTILTGDAEETSAFVRRFGYAPGPVAENIQRLVSDTDAVDVRNAAGYVPGLPGTGTADHVAFRAADVAALQDVEASLSRLNSSPTTVHDRKYFTSLYVREPGGTLFELATDGPGFAIDEPAGHLGETLFVPPHDAARAEDLKVMLPQFSMPGEPRLPRRDLPFVHRFYTPEDPDGSTFVLLHGTGGSEADLMPLAHRMAPRATMLGVRGRSHEEGIARWFRRMSPKVFDQADIHSEAEAFEAFMEGAISGYGLEAGRITFLGYSNGANFAAAVMALYPAVIRRAILLRAVPVLDPLPETDLTGSEVLVISGEQDPFGDGAPVLVEWLETHGAGTEHRAVAAGHQLTADDDMIARRWLSERKSHG
ncbi:VOC family protein [Mesorhizobium sp. NPDC059054]|uniref:VOC family protein n=1 Tax=Mesorhizobium sp. NPDC059054 TaxID=3346711 RepID=UPI0036927642